MCGLADVEKLKQLLGPDLFRRAFAIYSPNALPKEKLFCRYLAYVGDAILRLALIEKMSEFASLEDGRSLNPLDKKIRKLGSRKYLRQLAQELKQNVCFQAMGVKRIRKRMANAIEVSPETVEALIAAVYLTHGYQKAKEFVMEAVIQPYLRQGKFRAKGMPFKEFQPSGNAVSLEKVGERIDQMRNSLRIVDSKSIAHGYGPCEKPREPLLDCRV